MPADERELACPADGHISQLGSIEDGRILQAKGLDYSSEELLATALAPVAADFSQGSFVTIYLSPVDYHRVHLPFAGKLCSSIYIPGRLFAVNGLTTRNRPRLYTRNERLVAHFQTPAGAMAVVLVGALLVAGIETAWGGLARPRGRRLMVEDHQQPLPMDRGQELGLFRFGSTVVVLFANPRLRWLEELQPGQPVRMGQALGSFTPSAATRG